MKIRMKVMLMTLAMILTTVLVNAQPRGGERGGDPAEQAKEQAKRLQTQLELTDKQTKKIEKINLKYAEEMKTMRDEMMAKREAGEDVDREDMREKMQTLRTAQNEEVKGVLTPTQIEKFDVMMEERKSKGEERRKKGKKSKKGKKGEKPVEEEIDDSQN